MYLTAISAAWRYSGKVTGPASRFSSPSVIGVPDAALGVPSASLAAGVAAVVLVVELAFELDELELEFELEPQPATSIPLATSAVTAPVQVHLRISASSSGWMSCVDRGGFAEVAGSQEVAAAAQVGRLALEHEPSVAEHVGAI